MENILSQIINYRALSFQAHDNVGCLKLSHGGVYVCVDTPKITPSDPELTVIFRGWLLHGEPWVTEKLRPLEGL